MQRLVLILIVFFIFLPLEAGTEYFLTLRNSKVNLRLGPSFEYPVKIIYQKKYLPVLIQDTSENFRKIRDHENNTGWIHVSQLSKKKAAIVIDKNLKVFKKPTLFSEPIVILEMGRLCLVIKCKNEWCKIKTGDYKGWVLNDNLWGRI